MVCKNCGGDMVGDGYTDVRHCENLDLIGEGFEPDVNPVYCTDSQLKGVNITLSQQAEPCEFHDSDQAACQQYSGNVPCEKAPAQSERVDALETVRELSKEMDTFAAAWMTCNMSEFTYFANRLRAALSTHPAEEFNDSQWWFKELEQAVANGTPSQRRALEVVRNLLSNVNQSV